MHASWLWALFTILAAGGQTLRNALQRELIGALGSIGATQVRFLFGLPFAVVFLVGARFATQAPVPALDAASFAWSAFGAIAQIIATALMLAAMRERSFVVSIAYIKTEAVQVAVFSLVFLGESLTLSLGVAIALATAGVLAMSWPGSRAPAAGSSKSAALGLVSAGFFALAAVGFRAAILGVATPSFVLAASLILVVGLAVQTALLLIWLIAFDRKTLRAIIGVWRSSLFAVFGRAGLAILVPRLRLDQRHSRADPGVDRSDFRASRVAAAVSRRRQPARMVRHGADCGGGRGVAEWVTGKIGA